MLEKVNSACTMVWLGLAGFFRGLKDDKRGLSGVVVAVLLILVAVLAVALIWGLLSGTLQEWWDIIVGESSKITPTPSTL